VLNENEYQDPTDDRLSPASRGRLDDGEGSDEPVDDSSPENVGDMEQDASNGATRDTASRQDKAEKDKVSSQTSDETDFFNQGAEKNRGGGRLRAMVSGGRRKASIGLGTLILAGGGLGLFSFLQGPAQLFLLNSALGKPESAQENIVDRRIRRMIYRSTLRSADDRLLLARSRLGTVQNRVFGGMLDRLESRHGITFTETTGPVTGKSRPTIVFDLPDGHPLKGRTGTITRLNISKAFGISASKIPNLDGIGNNGQFSISQLDLDTSDLRGVKSWLSQNTGGGSLTRLSPKFAVAVNKRLFAKTLGLPSLFHPIRDLSEAAGRRIDNLVDPGGKRRARKQAGAASRESVKVNERQSGAKSELRSKVGKNIAKTAGVAIAVQGVMCMVKDIAGIVPKVYYATVVMPSMIRAIQTQGVVSQLASGEDFTSEQMADAIADLKDGDGRTVWGAKAMNSLTDGGEGRGTDIDVGARAAFTTQGGSIAGLTAALGFDDATGINVSDSVAGWACSSIARLGGLAVGLALTVGGIVSGVGSFGTTTAGAVTRVAAQAALAGTISYAVSRILGEFISGTVKDKVSDVCGVEYDSGESDKPEDIEILNAEAYGNCLAFAARMSSNINAASMGGVPISSSDEVALLDEVNNQEIVEFKQKGLSERLFSTKEKRSLVMTALRPMAESGISSDGLGSIVASLAKAPATIAGSFLSALSPKAHAEPATTYDWGFPLVSMPASIAEDPQYDSVDNVKWLTDNRDSVDESRAKKCFGKEIVGQGEQLRAVLLEDEVNPLSEEYKDANCGDLSNPDWIRTALFVMDDSIAAIMDCYDDAAASCTELGLNDSDETVDSTDGFASANNLNCEGYDRISSTPAVIVNGVPTNITQVPYNEATRTACASRKAECQAGVSGSQKALCAAFEFSDVYYGSTSLDESAQEKYGFTISTNALYNPTGWFEKRRPGLNPYNVLECSALTTVAVYRAFDYKSVVGCSGRWGERSHPELFKEIPTSELRPGDFVSMTLGCDLGKTSHIAIVAAPPDADGNIIVYEQSASGTTSHFRQLKLDRFKDGNHSRWIGPGL